jgi:UDP-galactopyranose mutase
LIAEECDSPVTIIDKRSHIAGNCFSEKDPETGIECHRYGAHIFHTSNQKVWDFVTRFGTFNLHTINHFYGKNFTPDEAKAFIASEIAKSGIISPSNLEEKAISLIGRPLYEAFIKGYTCKQWDTDPTRLPAHVIARLPVRFDYDSRYFNDTYEGIPTEGYTTLFKNILEHSNITLRLNTDFFDIRNSLSRDHHIIYTGPIDRYFEYRYGVLGWRTLDFEKQVMNHDSFQGTSVMNYADLDTRFTRILEFKHFHPERDYPKDKTVIVREYSRFAQAGEEPYYPINTSEDREKLALYEADAARETHVHFGGRLGSYKYWDMHHAIAAAMGAFETKIKDKIR